MESFEITKFPWHQMFYHIEGDGPHQSDKSHIETKSTPDFSEDIELPLPPGTSGDEFFVHVGCKAEALEASNIQPISYDTKSEADSFATNDLMCYPKLPINSNKILENKIPNQNEYDCVVSSGNKISDYMNDNIYSPSKVDSDEESQDTLLKPKVLGKEQAKKRLMAFSVTKQSANIAKKQNKTAPAKTKEKPPNPNKGTNFHEQFRATISAIEEEKKKIYRNMPEYLLQEMNELVKGNIVTTPNPKSSNNKNTDSKRKEKFSKHYSTLNKSKEYKRSQINRSPCSSRRRKRGRRSRSRSRSNGTHNKSEKRSWSRNRRSRSPVKKVFEEKPIKAVQTKFEKNVPDSIPSKKIFEDWKTFKNSGAAVENDSIISKNELNESESQEIELDNISQDSRSHFKPIFDYLKKGHHKMMFLRAKLAKPNIGKPVLFAEKTIKFTRTKPVIIWSENPFNATDYYMSREVLLENCPSDYVPILRFIFEGKSSESKIDDCQISCVKSRPWYPREKYLRHPSPCSEENTESLPQKPPLKNQEKESDVQSFKKKISLVNEDYLSDEIEEEEITVDGVKVQLDLEMNTVKVRSKWDSDFEDGKNQKESEKDHKIQSGEIRGGKTDKKSEEKLHFLVESRSDEDTNPHPGYLASEYEEFLKMVCFDSKDTQNSQAEKTSQYDDVKREKVEKKKLFKENEKNLNFSIDWDKESEEELKISSKKCQVKENRECEEDLNMSLEKLKIKNYLLKFEKPKKEKTGKLKQKTNIKIPSKVKKDTYKNSSSENSSSSESESDSDTDSDSGESKSSKKNKRKKINSKRKNFTKEKKKFKKRFSDKSENDLDIGKPMKESTKKIGGSSDNGESPNKLLEQIDVKKQMMLKKCEEKINGKKGKESEFKKESIEKDKNLKAEKKKGKNKSIKKKKLKKTETDSESNSGEHAKKKKKFKKKRSLSISSDSEKEKPKLKTFKHKKTKKEKRKKEMQYSSSSESDENLFSEKSKKKKHNVESSKDLKSNIFVKETNLEAEERLFERGQKVLKKKDKKFQNGDDDWETSSSSVESERRSENKWDEEIKTTLKVSDIDTVKEKNIDAVKLENERKEKILAPDNLVSETLKNSLSTFSFNENSFCGFGQELSRDFFLSERNFSNSANIGFCENSGITPIDARPFQCIGKGEEKKAVELYSPGYSDSEISEAEAKSQRSKTDSPDKDVYDPLNCDSESSVDNTEVETSSIPLPTTTEISHSDEAKPQNLGMSPRLKVTNELKKALPPSTPPLKFIGNELITGASLNESSPKMQITNCKNQQILKTKAASVFQDDSDEENKPLKSKEEKHKKTDFELEETKKSKKEIRDGSTERDQKRSHSRERKIKKSHCETVEASRREIRSDSFEIEPLSKGVTDEVVETVQPIPVLLGVSSNRVWSKSLPGYEFSQVPDSLIDQAESFDIYPSEESKYPSENYSHEFSLQKLSEKSSRRRKSRSRSLSPRKKRKSKSPIRRRSPKRWSTSPKYREKSPRSPRRRSSPKRKSPSKRRSKSPSRRKKSRRFSPRRSRSKSPLKRRSPKRWDSSPRRKDSPSRGYSPRRDSHYSNYSDSSYWMSTVETSDKIEDMEVSLQGCSSPQYDNSMSFPIMPAPIISEAQINNSFYDREYGNEYGVNNYMEEMGMNNLITINNHNVEKMESPKRPSLDQRIELELGSPMSASLPFPVASQPGQTFEGADPNHYQSYCCDSSGANENFYQNQTLPDFNGQYFNEVQPSNYGPYTYPLTHPQPPSVQNSVMQLGNVVEVVPTLQHAHLPPPPQPSTPQIMQVGNVLQVVPTQKVPTPVPVPPPVLDLDSLPSSPVIKTQKATAVVAPSSIVPPPNLEAMINPLIKAILSEREKRRKAKEKRRLEREARRKARQLRREAKLMSVSEKLKKSVQNEGLVLGQEVEDEELLDAMDIPSPPVPVQIITVSSPSGASPAAKGILITAGFVSKSPSKKKEVKFADGVFPGEGTSSSGEEDIPLSPPKPKLPNEKPFKKKKIKVKKKVKVHVIKQVLHEEEDDEDEDNLSPPPPPPGDPPPVFFARFPFAGNAQFPVYQTQTPTAATVQYPAPTI